VLFVTYGFPPARRAGCVRTWNIAKYLARSGWAVTVLTPDPALWRYVDRSEEAESNLEQERVRRLVTDHRWRLLAGDSLKCGNGGIAWLIGGISRRVARRVGIDVSVGWVKAAIRASSSLIASDVDVILASGPPFSAFSVAQRLSTRLARPYVLDYRDLWSRNPHFPVPSARRREGSAISGSAAVTTVSSSWATVLDRQFGVGSKQHVISNGYDSEGLTSVARHHFGHRAIVYAGSLWPPKRVISPLMAALRRLNDDVQWKFHYYGRHGDHVLGEAKRFGVTGRTVVHGEVPRARALEAVRGATVAVVITSVAETAPTEDNGMVTGKIFEAVGLGTPTLLIAPAGSDAREVAKVTGLARSFTAREVEGIVAFLQAMINGRALEPKDTAAYAWDNLVRKMDTVLREVIRR
jgi:hypothetical protein